MEENLAGGPPLPLWLTEPNEFDWEHLGLACRMERNVETKTWCAYVRLPDDHDWRLRTMAQWRHCDDAPEVHGGVTFAGALYVVGEWWLGFDCGHAWDYMPGLDEMWDQMRATGTPEIIAILDEMERTRAQRSPRFADHYRTFDYVKEQTEYLAEQVVTFVPQKAVPSNDTDTGLSFPPQS